MKDRIDFYINFFDEIVKRAEDNANKEFGYISQDNYPDTPFGWLPRGTQLILDSEPIYVESTLSNNKSFIRTPGCILQINKVTIYGGHLSNTQYRLHIPHEFDEWFALSSKLSVDIGEDGFCNASFDWCQIGFPEDEISMISRVIRGTVPKLEESWNEFGMASISCNRKDDDKKKEFFLLSQTWLEERRKFGQEQAMLKRIKQRETVQKDF